MTDLIREYLNSKDLRLHGSNVSVMPGENGTVLSPGTFPGDIFGGSYPQMDPNKTPQEMGQRMSDAQQNTGLGNVLVGGAKRAIQGLVDQGTEYLELGGEQFLAQAGLTRGGEPINLSIPKPVLFKDIPKPEGALEGIAQDFAQFGAGMVISPAKTNVVKGMLSGTYFDPENGAFISGLRELGIGKEALEFLDFKVGSDASTEDRVIARMFQGLEEGVLTAFGEGIIGTLKQIKKTPALLEKARTAIIQAGKNAEARMSEGGVQLNTGLDPDPLIAGAGKLVSRAVGPGGQDYIGFYSKLTDEIKNLPDGTKGSFDQLRATLINKDVKDDEFYWTGFDDFFEGRTDITKAEMLEFAEKNRIEVEEVVKTGTDADTQLTFGNQRNLTPQEAHGENYLEQKAQELLDQADIDMPDDPPGSLDEYRIIAESNYYDDPIVRITDYNTGLVIQGREDVGYDLFKNEAEAGEYTNRINTEPVGDLNEMKIQAEGYARENDLIKFDNEVTRYSQYTELGGKNYQEIVLTVPNLNKKISPSDEVSPVHFPDDEGYLLHIRTKDRTNKDGKKILYIEELQSDYAKKRKQFGLREGTDEYENAKKLLMDARKEAKEIGKKLGLQNVSSTSNLETFLSMIERYRQTIIESGSEELGKSLTSIPSQAVIDRLRKLSRIEKLVNPNILEAPFVDSDNKWVQMSIKYMIKKAIDEGYDGIAWTSGDVQVARYPSAYRSNIDKLDITLLEKGVNDPNKKVYMINEISKGGPGSPNGGPTTEILMSPKAVSENEIKKMFSEELANKIIADGKAQFDETLEASRNIVYNNPGGEFTRQGMHNQYDKILPTNTGKVVEKLDKNAKVEILQIEFSVPGGFVYGDNIEDRLGIMFTDKMKNKASVSGQPLFTGPVVAGAGGAGGAGAIMANQEGASDGNTN